MNHPSASATRDSGLLPKDDRKPPKFAFAVWLYRNDLIFKSLVDFALVGLVVVPFVINWSPLPGHILGGLGKLYQAYFGIERGVSLDSSNDWASPRLIPGTATIQSMGPLTLDDEVIATAPADQRPTLTEVQYHLAHNGPESALAVSFH